MVTETTPPPEPVTDTSWLVDLQAQYLDLIDRYVPPPGTRPAAGRTRGA